MHQYDPAASRRARARRRKLQATGLIALLALISSTAHATWSIVAVDPISLEVGVAAAACAAGVDTVVGLVPGRAAIAAQGFWSREGKARLAALLAAGHAPDEALAAVASAVSDAPFGIPLFRLRQYGVATLPPMGGVATYTGAWTFGVAGARGDRNAGVQGVFLRSEKVLTATLEAFTTPGPASCPRPLAERLLAGLEAGAAAGGDRRCSAELAALSAVLVVAAPGDAAESPSLFLRAVRPGDEAPAPAADLRRLLGWPERGAREDGAVPRLRAAFDAWRVARPERPRCAATSEPDSVPQTPPLE